MSHDWETGSWKDTACSFVSLIHSLGSTADSCSLWANTWPSYESWKLMFSIKSMQEVHGEALVTNDSRPHLPADHVLCQVSLWSTSVCRVWATIEEGITVPVWCAATTNKLPVCLGSCVCQHHFQPPSFPWLEQAPVLGDGAGETSPDTRGTWCWETNEVLIPSSCFFHQNSCLLSKKPKRFLWQCDSLTRKKEEAEEGTFKWGGHLKLRVNISGREIGNEQPLQMSCRGATDQERAWWCLLPMEKSCFS